MSEHDSGVKSRFQWTAAESAAPERAIVIVADLRRRDGDAAATAQVNASGRSVSRSPAAQLAEAVGLARAIGLDVVHAGVVTIRERRPSALLGSGKIDEIAGMVKADGIGLVVVDHPLTPVQQRNLEKAWQAKVLDRTGLILEIFGERAHTREGRLQVELARLTYQKGRLVRQWTHLERQRGGLGKTGGPGETQIEADRRLLQERILKLERELDKVRRTRSLHRAKRKKVPTPVVALVGYTNAGKSTLFNRLTGAQVFAENLLFATLDPTLRRLTLPRGSEIILSDTVGFVSNLPTMLVAAFRATLEEVTEAELILHVRDIADPDSAAQAEDVHAVLDEMGIAARDRIIEVWNKIDLLPAERLAAMRAAREEGPEAPLLVSAVTGEGVDRLLQAIEAALGSAEGLIEISLAPSALGRLPEIYRHGQVVERVDGEDGGVRLKVRPQPFGAERLRALAAGA
ncbi:MAG: GTPase HflX [Alphaproteobacteria bacterium]|nr:MAG: GTPase HflX [Alphaproteobacteria bacterium]